MRAQSRQHHAKIVVLHERFRVLPGGPFPLMTELLDFSLEIEFEIWRPSAADVAIGAASDRRVTL